jgi:hypothetical protein
MSEPLLSLEAHIFALFSPIVRTFCPKPGTFEFIDLYFIGPVLSTQVKIAMSCFLIKNTDMLHCSLFATLALVNS